MSRKVIQIAATSYGETGDGGGMTPDLYALCDDGTIWNLVGSNWSLVEPIPQMEAEDAP